MPVNSPSANSLFWPLKCLWNYESPCLHSSVLAEYVAGFSQLDWFFLQCRLALWQATANWINSLGVSPGLPHRQTRSHLASHCFLSKCRPSQRHKWVGRSQTASDGPVAHRQNIYLNPALPQSPFWNTCGPLIVPYKIKLAREFATFPFILLQWSTEKVKSYPDRMITTSIHCRRRDNRTLSCTQ